MKRFAILALLAASLCIAPSQAQSTFHGNNARTGVYPGTGPKTLGGVKWAFKTSGPIVTSPAVADGVVYIASLGGHLYAVDQETGVEKWNFKSRMPIASRRPCRTIQFISCLRPARWRRLTRHGKPKWCSPPNSRESSKQRISTVSGQQTIPDAWDIFTSSPAVADGKVYFGSGTRPRLCRRCRPGFAVEVSGGRRAFPPAVVNRIVYIGAGTAAHAIEPGTPGEMVVEVREDRRSTTGSDSTSRRTAQHGSRELTSTRMPPAGRGVGLSRASPVIGTPAGRRHGSGTSDSARFMALDAKSGRLRFNFDAKAYMFSSAALAGELAYVGDHNGKLYAIDSKTGKLAWEFQSEASKKDPMKVLNPDGSLNQEAFAPVFGDFEDMYLDIYRYISIGAIMSSPAVDRGVVFFGSMDGNLYALQ